MKGTAIEKADEAREYLIKATKLLNEIVEESNEETEDDDWADNRLEFWSRILLAGGVVSEQKAHEIWEKDMKKKDSRGYGGNFAGKRASLQYTHDGKVMLAKNADDKCKAWKGKSLEEYAQQFKKK